MNLKNGRHLDRRVKDATGDKGFVLWIEHMFDPCTYFVRGESFEDAYAWFLCDPKVEAELKVDDNYEDYIEGWDRKWVYGKGATNKATLADLERAYADSKTLAIELNDNGTIVDTDCINGMELREYVK